MSSNWKPGEPIVSPVDSMRSLDPKSLARQDIYKLMIGAIVPRPIALISTISRGGQGNLAPFSSFNLSSSDPACVVVSIYNRPEGSKKDTLRNILETGEFVINTVSDWFVTPMVHTAADFDPTVNEMSLVGFTPVPSIKVKPPRVKESPIHMECTLYKHVPLENDSGKETCSVIIGKIVLFHIWEKAYAEGKISLSELQPVARLGGASYASVREPYSIPIPKTV